MSVGVAISTVPEREDMAGENAQRWLDVGVTPYVILDHKREGVAVTKNRGIAFLMDVVRVDHLFLADDDMHPLSRESWERYTQQSLPHLSLSWGKRRRLTEQRFPGYSEFSHPRGVLLYLHRSAVERIGGMRTEFGRGGDEHVDLSRRAHLAGLTPAPYLDLDQDVREWFHCEDMIRPGEKVHQLQARRRRISTIRRTAADRKHIAEVWRKYAQATDFVPYSD